MAKLDFSKRHLKNSALAFVYMLAFLLEIVAFATFVLITELLPVSHTNQNVTWLIMLVLLLAFWSMFMSPKAKYRLDWSKYYPIKAIIYTVAAVSIYHHFGIVWVSIFAGLSLVVDIILYPYRNIDPQVYFGNPNAKKDSKK
jgi:hypothetical protein